VFTATESAAAPLAKPAAGIAATEEPVKATPVIGPVGVKSAMSRERLAAISYNDYVLAHEELLERYSEIESMEKTRGYIQFMCFI